MNDELFSPWYHGDVPPVRPGLYWALSGNNDDDFLAWSLEAGWRQIDGHSAICPRYWRGLTARGHVAVTNAKTPAGLSVELEKFAALIASGCTQTEAMMAVWPKPPPIQPPQPAEILHQSERQPKHPINLSSTEREELRRRAAKRKSASPVEPLRAKIVLMAADGTPNTVIADRLKVTVHTVRYWRERFHRRGLAGLDPLPRPGRPRAADRAPRALMATLSSSALAAAAALRDAKRQLSRADPHRKPRPASANLAALEQLLPPGRPPCFDSQAVWDDYIQHAAVSGRRAHSDGPVIWLRRDEPALNRAFSFCEDCTSTRRARMQGENRCLPDFLKGPA